MNHQDTKACQRLIELGKAFMYDHVPADRWERATIDMTNIIDQSMRHGAEIAQDEVKKLLAQPVEVGRG